MGDEGVSSILRSTPVNDDRVLTSESYSQAILDYQHEQNQPLSVSDAFVLIARSNLGLLLLSSLSGCRHVDRFAESSVCAETSYEIDSVIGLKKKILLDALGFDISTSEIEDLLKENFLGDPGESSVELHLERIREHFPEVCGIESFIFDGAWDQWDDIPMTLPNVPIMNQKLPRIHEYNPAKKTIRFGLWLPKGNRWESEENIGYFYETTFASAIFDFLWDEGSLSHADEIDLQLSALLDDFSENHAEERTANPPVASITGLGYRRKAVTDLYALYYVFGPSAYNMVEKLEWPELIEILDLVAEDLDFVYPKTYAIKQQAVLQERPDPILDVFENSLGERFLVTADRAGDDRRIRILKEVWEENQVRHEEVVSFLNDYDIFSERDFPVEVSSIDDKIYLSQVDLEQGILSRAIFDGVSGDVQIAQRNFADLYIYAPGDSTDENTLLTDNMFSEDMRGQNGIPDTPYLRLGSWDNQIRPYNEWQNGFLVLKEGRFLFYNMDLVVPGAQDLDINLELPEGVVVKDFTILDNTITGFVARTNVTDETLLWSLMEFNLNDPEQGWSVTSTEIPIHSANDVVSRVTFPEGYGFVLSDGTVLFVSQDKLLSVLCDEQTGRPLRIYQAGEIETNDFSDDDVFWDSIFPYEMASLSTNGQSLFDLHPGTFLTVSSQTDEMQELHISIQSHE